MIRHKKYERLVVLDFYRDVCPEEKLILEKHLSICPRCCNFQKALLDTMPRRREGDGPKIDALLSQAREEFHRNLPGDRKARASEHKFRLQPRKTFPVPAYVTAAIAFVMFGAGIAAGIFFFNRSTPKSSSLLSELTFNNRNDVAIDNVRFLPTDEKSGEIKFSFDFIKRCEMNGTLDDRDVQQVLAFAVGNSDNAGVRMKTVGMLGTTVNPDSEIEGALIRAAKTDDNAGVRREALLSLKKYPFDGKIRDAFLFILQNDNNPGMRVSAINYLGEKETALSISNSKHIDPQILNVLKQKSSSDLNKYVRLKAAGMLKEIAEL